MSIGLLRGFAASLFPTVRTLAFAAGAVVLLGGLFPAGVFAQKEEVEGPPKPEEITLETKDQLLLKATWYASDRGKKAVPIIMLHGYEGRRTEYVPLALYLQAAGHAVLVPDLRGHGQSVRFKGGDDVIKAEDLKERDYAAMMAQDLERCKKFLMERHNAGELNIELLCVVAAEMSTVLAMNWAVSDWSWPMTPTLKQGQDVKALVLLSPEPKIARTSINTVQTQNHYIFTGKGPRLSILIAVGQQGRSAYMEAKKLHTSLERARGKVPASEAAKRQDLFLDSLDTELEGTKLIDPRFRLGEEQRILNFIKVRLVAKAADYKWESREPPK